MKKSLLIIFMALLLPAIALAENKAIKFLATQGYATTLIKPQGDDRLEIPETLLTDRTEENGGGIYVDLKTSFTFSGWFNLYDWFQQNKTMGSGLLMIGQRVHANNNPSIGLRVLRPADYSNTNKRGNGGILSLMCGDPDNKIGGDITGENATLNLDEWVYLTLVYSLEDQEIRVYKNAELIDSRKSLIPLRLLPDTPGIIYTGAFAMNGMCDELQFWTRALSDAEIKTAYYQADAVEGLDLWYDFDELVPVAEDAEEGTESGTFLNKGTTEKGQGINATYYHCAAEKYSFQQSGVINLATFTEKEPELVAGREIQGLPSYTVTVPEVTLGTLTVMDGDNQLGAGTHSVPVGGQLTITATPNEGCALVKLKYAGQYITSGSTVDVTEDAAIEAEFTDKFATLTVADTEAEYTLTPLNGTELNLTSVPVGTELSLAVAGWPETKTLKQVLLGEQVLEPAEDGTYLFSISEDTTLDIQLRDLENYTVTFPATVANGTIIVADAKGVTLESGATVLENSTITVTANPDPGYVILFVRANGTDITSGEEVVITGNTVITAEMAAAVAFVPGRQKNGASTHDYSFRFSQSVLDGSRNFTYSAWLKPTSASVLESRTPKGRIMGDITEGELGTQGAFAVVLSNGKLQLQAKANGEVKTLDTEVEMPLNEYAFLTVVADDESKTISLYKNCELAGTISTSAGNDAAEDGGEGEGTDPEQPASTGGLDMLTAAASFYVYDNASAGYLDEAQVWNRVLTIDEIKRSTRVNAIPENLVALYRPRKGDQEIYNLGTLGNGTDGKYIAGMYAGYYSSKKWTNPARQIIFDAGSAHDPARVSVTTVQPAETEIGTYALTGEEGRVLDGEAYLYEPVNVDLSGISGATVSGITVKTGNEETTYTLEQLPFIAEGDIEVSLNYEVLTTVKFTYEGEHGSISLKINDEEPVDVTGTIEIPKNATLVITAKPEENYELTVASINGEKIYDLYELENEAGDDGTIDHDFYDGEYTYQAGTKDINLNLTFNLVRHFLVAEVYGGSDSDKDLYPVFTYANGDLIDRDNSAYVKVYHGTEVYLNIWSVLEENYESDGDHYVLTSVKDFVFDDQADDYDYDNSGDITDKLQTPEDGTDEDKTYYLGPVTNSHWFYIYQNLLSGIVAVETDHNGMIKVTDQGITLSEEADIEIVDMNGRTVARTHGTVLSVDSLVKGVYVAKATTASSSCTLKFIKTK